MDFCLKLHLFLQAIEQYGDVDIYTSNFRPMKATLSGLPDRVFMKLIVCAKTNKILGLHMCGEDSPEIVQVSAIILYLLFRLNQKLNCEAHVVVRLLNSRDLQLLLRLA